MKQTKQQIISNAKEYFEQIIQRMENENEWLLFMTFTQGSGKHVCVKANYEATEQLLNSHCFESISEIYEMGTRK